MRKGKVGLQKDVSRIFTGIQVPKKNAPDTSAGPVVPPVKHIPKSVVHAPPKPPTPAPPKPAAPAPLEPAAPAPPKPVSPAPPEPVTPIPPKLAAPASPVVSPPKPTTPPPKPFTIPEPSQPSAAASKPAVSEPPTSKKTVYEPPVTRQAIYEPPVPVSAPATDKQVRIGTVVGSLRQSPLLKIWEQVSAKLLAPKPGVSPARQKVMLVMMLVLPIVFVIVLSKVLFTPAQSRLGPGGETGSSAAVGLNSGINWQLPPPYPENIRDPMVFVTITQPQEGVGRPVVRGIVFSEDKPCAVVGERIVSVGDVVEGATIVKINSDSVEFSMGDENWIQKVER
jgi:hypothetical protein